MRLGIDLGATRIKAGLVNADGMVVQRIVAPTSEVGEGGLVADRIAEVVAPMVPRASVVGLAAAGVLDRARGVIRESPNFPAWRDVPLGELVSSRLERSVTLENDANAVIWGESQRGGGRGAAHLIGYTLGSGVGGALVLAGQLWRGPRGMAGELGHVVVERDGRACGCGARGCLEQYAGALGMRRRLTELGYSELAAHEDAPRLAAEEARHGNAEIRAIFSEMGAHLGVAIASMLHALDVERVVVAGGLVGTADLFLPSTKESMRAHTYASVAEGVEIVVGTLGEDAGIIGAALLS